MTDKLTLAPLNQKDILEDLLFEQLFEYNPGYVENDFIALGFINAVPVAVKWQFDHHVIDICIDKRMVDDLDRATDLICSRLDEINNEPDAVTICKYARYEGLGLVTASFYYKDNE